LKLTSFAQSSLFDLGYHPFSVYFTSDLGDLYVLCPFLPAELIIPHDWFMTTLDLMREDACVRDLADALLKGHTVRKGMSIVHIEAG
jgi:hypothetical protein